MTCFRRVDQQLLIEVRLLIYIGGLSTKFFIRVCPLKYIRGLSTKLFIRVRPLIYIGGLSTNKTNIFVLKTFFSYMENACVRESMRTRCMGLGM